MTARINQIDTVDSFHVLKVTELAHEKEDVVKIPIDVDISPLSKGSVITYYRAEEDLSVDEVKIPAPGHIVLIFKRQNQEEKLPDKDKRFLWLEKGTELLSVERLPRIVEILLGVSDYYGKRRDLVEKSLEILKLTQDPETLDALFSMPIIRLYDLLGDKVYPSVVQKNLPLCYAGNALQVSDAFISVQIADQLVALALAGADVEHPRRRDVRQILSLAVLHGLPHQTAHDFIVSYERE